MSIFSKIGMWLVGVFNKTRPGLLQFLHDHEAQATEIVIGLARQFAGQPMNSWRDTAFSTVKSAIDSANQHPDTWISLLVDLGHDIAKAQETPTESTPQQ